MILIFDLDLSLILHWKIKITLPHDISSEPLGVEFFATLANFDGCYGGPHAHVKRKWGVGEWFNVKILCNNAHCCRRAQLLCKKHRKFRSICTTHPCKGIRSPATAPIRPHCGNCLIVRALCSFAKYRLTMVDLDLDLQIDLDHCRKNWSLIFKINFPLSDL